MKQLSTTRHLFKLALFTLFTFNLHMAHALELRVPKPKGSSGQHKIELLNLIAKHSSQPITIVQKETFNRLQEISMLQTKQLNVMWAPKNQELEDQLLAVKIPLDKEIVGSVAIIVRQNELTKFKNIDNLRELKSLKAGVRKDTVTRRILEDHSFNIVATLRGHYGHMLDGERFDYFPVAASNAYKQVNDWSEKEKLDLVVHPDLLLKLPLNSYFYVEKGNIELAATIKEALIKAIEAGDFDAVLKASPGYQATQKFLERHKVKVMDVEETAAL